MMELCTGFVKGSQHLLFFVHADDNSLTGTIPSELGRLTKLTRLELGKVYFFSEVAGVQFTFLSILAHITAFFT